MQPSYSALTGQGPSIENSININKMILVSIFFPYARYNYERMSIPLFFLVPITIATLDQFGRPGLVSYCRVAEDLFNSSTEAG